MHLTQIVFVPSINLLIQSKDLLPLLARISLFLCCESQVNIAELAENRIRRDLTSQTSLHKFCIAKQFVGPNYLVFPAADKNEILV